MPIVRYLPRKVAEIESAVRPWKPPEKETIFSRPVTMRAIRIAFSLASVPELQKNAFESGVGATETSSYNVGSGQNYFSLLAVDPQLIRSILITSTIPLENIEQIRVGGVETPQDIASVPEPGSLLLFGTGLLAVGRRLKRRRRAA